MSEARNLRKDGKPDMRFRGNKVRKWTQDYLKAYLEIMSNDGDNPSFIVCG